MFNLQGSEIIIILLLALVVLGPEKLPDAMRKMGQFYAELRKMSSGFQEEFRNAVDEPLREIRDTANTLRDSADFTKLQDGTREEKPKSAEMAPAGDPAAAPVDDVPTFEPGDAADAAPELTPDSAAAPFDDAEPTRRRVPTEPTPVPDPPAPFTGMSSVPPPASTDAGIDPEPVIDPEPEVDAETEADGEPDASDAAGDVATDDVAPDDVAPDDETTDDVEPATTDEPSRPTP